MLAELIDRRLCLSKEVVKVSEQQQKFLDALRDPNIYAVPARNRYRWAADIAGYSNTTSIASIVRPLQDKIIELAEKMIAEASLSAAWVLQETVDGENIEAVATKYKLAAASEILDRAVPKKTAKACLLKYAFKTTAK